MALTLTDANKNWQKVEIALSTLNALSLPQNVLRALKGYLSQIKRNPDLQFVPITDLGADAIIADVACRVYLLFLKKGNTATAAFVKAADHATSAGTTASDFVQELNAAKQEVLVLSTQGWAQGTGFTIGSDTTADGSTASTAGDGPNGFALIGAA